MILRGFWRSKIHEKSCFFWTSFFHKKVGFFTGSTHSQAKHRFLSGQGRFWRTPDPTKTEKSELWTFKKHHIENTWKIMVFHKTMRTAEPSNVMVLWRGNHGSRKIRRRKTHRIAIFLESINHAFSWFWYHLGRPKTMKNHILFATWKKWFGPVFYNGYEQSGSPESSKNRMQKKIQINDK